MDNQQHSPKFSQQPENKRIDFLRGLIPNADEQRNCDDSGPPLSEKEVTRMRESVTADYESWAKALGLEPIPLDVYGYCKTSDAKTNLGTSVTNGVPGYNGSIIVMPLWPKPTREQGMDVLAFPPVSWKEELPTWPEWRTNLLHELVHQLEHRVLHIWTGEEDPHTYYKALEEAAARISIIKPVTLDELRMLTWPQIVEQIKLSSRLKASSEVDS
jgi:hypothetical protein